MACTGCTRTHVLFFFTDLFRIAHICTRKKVDKGNDTKNLSSMKKHTADTKHRKNSPQHCIFRETRRNIQQAIMYRTRESELVCEKRRYFFACKNDSLQASKGDRPGGDTTRVFTLTAVDIEKIQRIERLARVSAILRQSDERTES